MDEVVRRAIYELSSKLDDLRASTGPELLYEAFAGEVEAMEAGMTAKQQQQLHDGAAAVLAAAGL